MLLTLIALGTLVATLLGGAVALKLRDRLHLLLGFSAGAVLGVALFDLAKEAIVTGIHYHAPATILLTIGIGFLGYLVLDRTILLHSHVENSDDHQHASRGAFGAGTLSIHSFLDGVGIGIGFQVSAAVGLIVALAVLAHDFSDGVNTVNMVLRNGGTRQQASRWLLADAIAPVFGIASTLLLSVPDSAIGLALALFAGFFLYISASDLIPESHHQHPRFFTTLMTILGAGLIFLVVHLAG
ncbi:ZIP family metal transporter [Candidatus Kaiserbacteria bacterium]|nr:ZIP family metal transporter [Candidatus Kaiserbacteria bacterium]